jgi:uncharacterized protein
MHVILKNILKFYKTHKNTRIFSLIGWRGVDAIQHLLEHGNLPSPQFSYCFANVNRYCLDLHGDIYTCVTVAGMNEFSVGKFYPKIEFKHPDLDAWRTRNVRNIPKCSACKWALICGGGCSFLALTSTGSLQSSYCFDIEKILQLAIEYYFPEMEREALTRNSHCRDAQ